jgi:hypothetical protein
VFLFVYWFWSLSSRFLPYVLLRLSRRLLWTDQPTPLCRPWYVQPAPTPSPVHAYKRPPSFPVYLVRSHSDQHVSHVGASVHAVLAGAAHLSSTTSLRVVPRPIPHREALIYPLTTAPHLPSMQLRWCRTEERREDPQIRRGLARPGCWRLAVLCRSAMPDARRLELSRILSSNSPRQPALRRPASSSWA